MLLDVDVMAYGENAMMERKLRQLANQVVLVGIHSSAEIEVTP